MQKTNIQYLTHTWNPICMRCTPVSPACKNCWHLKRADMLANNPLVLEDLQACYRGDSPPKLVDSRLNQPINKKPAIIGTGFMGDLFHDDIHPAYIVKVFNTIYECPQHKFLILTKRSKNMLTFYEWIRRGNLPFMTPFFSFRHKRSKFPPDNLWVGVTVEDSDHLWRIDDLMKIPAAVRFVSVEPMLEKINLPIRCPECGYGKIDQDIHFDHKLCNGPGWIDWIVAAPETGPGARPMDPEWAFDLYRQCKDAGVPFFYKLNDLDLPKEFPKGV